MTNEHKSRIKFVYQNNERNRITHVTNLPTKSEGIYPSGETSR